MKSQADTVRWGQFGLWWMFVVALLATPVAALDTLPAQPPWLGPGIVPTHVAGPYPLNGQRPWGHYTPFPRSVQAPAEPPAPASPVRLEVAISNPRPYMLETVLYTVRVVSDGNIFKLDPVVPNVYGIAHEQIGGVNAYLRTDDAGRNQVVNEIRFAITPLREGHLVLPPLGVEAVLEKNDGTTNLWTDSLTLDTLPTAVHNGVWLPLEDLTVDVRLDLDAQPRAGQPFVLTVVLSARGAGGAQLPTVVSLFRTEEFKFYPTKTLITREIDADGQSLVGTRVETFTVVPQAGGSLRLPDLIIPWWDAVEHQERHTVWTGRSLEVAGPLGGDKDQENVLASGLPSALSFMMFLALSTLMAIGIGVWVAQGTPWFALRWRKPPFDPAPSESADGGGRGRVRGALLRFLHGIGARWSSSPLVGWLTRRSRAALQLWRCVRAVDASRDAGRLCKALRRFASDLTRLPLNTPLPGFVEWIIARRPRLNGDGLRELVRELESSVYGNGELDLQRWKRSFKRSLRRILLARTRDPKSARRARALPVLNPSG